MYKITLLVYKNFRNFFIVCLALVSSFCVYGSEPLRYSSYNFSLFSPIFDFDNEKTDVRVYGPITAEQAGYVNQEEFLETGNLDSDVHDHMDHDAHDHGPSEVFDIDSSSMMASNSILENIKTGSLIIPMDNTLQQNGNGFNMFSYGVVVRILHAEIPVKWAIRDGKSKDGIDFTANSKIVRPTQGNVAAFNYRSGPFIVSQKDAAAALAIIDQFNSSVSNSNRVKVYELTDNSNIEIRNTLFQKPKVAILNNGSNQSIHINVFSGAGLDLGTHYVTDLNASQLDNDSCVTLATEPHADDVQTEDVDSVRTFLQSGGNFLVNVLQ